jgi:hypothetical protein
MESFLMLVSILTLGTVTVTPDSYKPTESIARSIKLDKSNVAQGETESINAPAKILELCRGEVKKSYQGPKSGVTHYKCSGKDVMFFSVDKHFYASIESNELEAGFALVANERISRSLSRQVRKMYRDSAEQAKADVQVNNL